MKTEEQVLKELGIKEKLFVVTWIDGKGETRHTDYRAETAAEAVLNVEYIYRGRYGDETVNIVSCRPK